MAYYDINPMDIDPDTGRPYANYSSDALDTSFHDSEIDTDDEPMRQQADVWVHLTYDADAELEGDELRAEIQDDLNRLLDADSESRVELQIAGIATIREEAVIYGNAHGLPDILLTIKAITAAFPPTLHRNEAQKRALAAAYTLAAELA